ncbi:hypothetical protein ACIRL2_45225 [Embleya sp. NPDC127516]|uniref:hypothetical protein n=1 Tax=Embleya sp. NPDC127516 TaxID=3363990 RepID=UPI0037FD15C4
MTDMQEFRSLFTELAATPYPSRARLEALREVGSLLLGLDTHVAGYASQVHGGHMQAEEVPDLPRLVAEVESLRRAASTVRAQSEQDVRLGQEYVRYIEILESLVRSLERIAHGQK